MKLNLGFKGLNYRFTLFAVSAFKGFLKEPAIGATFGFVF
jgi:hypothetical protein